MQGRHVRCAVAYWWRCSQVVDESALDQAEIAWRYRTQRKSCSIYSHLVFADASLFHAIGQGGDKFRGVGFVFFADHSVTRGERDAGVEAILAYNDKLSKPILTVAERDALKGWPVDDVFSNWKLKDIDAWPRHFVNIHKHEGEWVYHFYERVYVTSVDGADGGGMVFAVKVKNGI